MANRSIGQERPQAEDVHDKNEPWTMCSGIVFGAGCTPDSWAVVLISGKRPRQQCAPVRPSKAEAAHALCEGVGEGLSKWCLHSVHVGARYKKASVVVPTDGRSEA